MLETVLKIALEAGQRIQEVGLSGDLDVQIKPDGSPVTRADLLAHEFISEALEREFALPVISEEREAPSYEIRQRWDSLFLVDPLDGTKDFISGSGEYTINIALVRERQPVLAVVYVPALDELFYAELGKGAWLRRGDQTLPLPQERPQEWILARSWFHDNPTVEAFAQRNKITRNTKMSSAIRLPRLAQGRVTLCLVSNQSSEWDIAAGHLMVKETGGTVVELVGRTAPSYNKPNLKNTFLLAAAGQISLEQVKTGD